MKYFIIIAILLFGATVYADERVLECLHSKDACVMSCSGSTKCVKACLSAYESCIHGGSKRQRPQESEKTYQSTIEIGDPHGHKENSGGFIDPATGKFHPPVTGGAIDPKTGTFFPKTNGGYINTKTGEFIPAN